MSNITNVCWRFSGVSSNQLNTDEMFFHWFSKIVLFMFVFIFSSIFSLSSPISLFARLINLQVGLFLKFSLWSFNVMKATSMAKKTSASTEMTDLQHLTKSVVHKQKELKKTFKNFLKNSV